MMNGSETLHRTGGRRLTIAGVGLVEVFENGSVSTLEPLARQQQERLVLWLEHEWPQVRNGHGGYVSRGNV